jgi:ribosomal protein S12 methylthiotransferase accessory factor
MNAEPPVAMPAAQPQAGTLRERPPEHTQALLQPRLRDYGITRVAELTGLDTIGLPVYMAVRPLGTTVGTSQGKGATPVLAWISAVMEAIEIELSERFDPPDAFVATAAELDLPYEVPELTLAERSVASGRFPLPWVTAESIPDGQRTFVPLHLIALDGICDNRWRPLTVFSSSNGTGAGNSLAEATVHALLETIERYSTTSLARTPIGQRKVVDLRSLPAGPNQDLIGRLRADGFWVEVVDCSAVPGTTTFAAFLWRPDMPSLYAGAGCHVLPETALWRALTEAVQSRMSVISGVREDIGPESYRGVRHTALPPAVEPNHPWDAIPAPVAGAGCSGVTLASRLARQVSAISGRPVLRVDLTPPGEPFAVCKVVAPGLPALAGDGTEELPREPDPAGTPDRTPDGKEGR